MKASKILAASSYLYVFKDKKDNPVVKELTAKYTEEALKELIQMNGHNITLRYRDKNDKWQIMACAMKSFDKDGSFIVEHYASGDLKEMKIELNQVIEMWTVD